MTRITLRQAAATAANSSLSEQQRDALGRLLHADQTQAEIALRTEALQVAAQQRPAGEPGDQ
jgi:hypothetical protein